MIFYNLSGSKIQNDDFYRLWVHWITPRGLPVRGMYQARDVLGQLGHVRRVSDERQVASDE